MTVDNITPDPRMPDTIRAIIADWRERANVANMLQNDNVDRKLNTDVRNFYNRMARIGAALLNSVATGSLVLTPDITVNWWSATVKCDPLNITESYARWMGSDDIYVVVELQSDGLCVLHSGRARDARWEDDTPNTRVPCAVLPVPFDFKRYDPARVAVYLTSEPLDVFMTHLHNGVAFDRKNHDAFQ